MKKLILLAITFSLNSFAQFNINLDRSILDSSQMVFETHIGKPDSMQNALALNVQYHQIKKMRNIIEDRVNTKLKFLTAWQINGEAHVTTISPVEFSKVLRHHITMNRINEIARNSEIQNADLIIYGLGSGKKIIDGKTETTFFLIVDSLKLRAIRQSIYTEFILNGGHPSLFDPAWFFPHITIGYTKKDIHENSGLLKNIKFSYDNRFKVQIH